MHQVLIGLTAPVLGFFGVVGAAVVGLMGAGINATFERRANQPFKERAQEITGMAESVKALIPTVAALREELDNANDALAACVERDLAKGKVIAQHGEEIAELRRLINAK